MKFDVIVVTAANEAQAKGYRAQVAELEGKIAPKILVVPDPGGRRVGSLGSTVAVLRHLARTIHHPLNPSTPQLLNPSTSQHLNRLLICHSGGDSKRLPSYAALGKAFVTMPDGRTMFEHIVELMEKLPARPGVTVCCGDVIPHLDAAQVSFSETGVTGVAYPDGPWQAQRHGVYLVQSAECRVQSAKAPSSKLQAPSSKLQALSSQLQAPSPLPVTGFLQKPQVKRGTFLIDTGILHFDWATAAKMTKLPIAGDIYEEFPKMLLEGFAPFHVSVVPSCEFFHIGSSRELLKLLGRKNVVVDGCRAEIAKLGGENIVTFVPAEYGPVSLGKGECLTCLPLGAKRWYPLKYRIDDDFKKDGTWDRLELGEIMKKVNHARLLALKDEGKQMMDAGILVEKPLRIDLAGGWSDTPPICNAMGGRVFNAAVALEGEKPVKVCVRRIPAREVRVESVDLGKSGVLKTMREIRAPKDAHDWCALVKSALTVTDYDLKEGGLEIRISADVPKGSGMGTSSILGSAVVEALLKIRAPEKRVEWSAVSELTLRLEKEMGTGGGWQDQMGALVPGVKIVESDPGAEQVIRVRRLPAKAERAFAAFLEERALLFFTGRKRMARNVLRGVLNFYRENPEDIAHEIIRRLKSDAERAFRAVKRGDWDAFCAAMNGYWLSKKALDPGSTNPLVESIIARMAPWTSAVTLCGAGGGGFMFTIATSRAAKAKIKSAFGRNPHGCTGRFYDFSLVLD